MFIIIFFITVTVIGCYIAGVLNPFRTPSGSLTMSLYHLPGEAINGLNYAIPLQHKPASRAILVLVS